MNTLDSKHERISLRVTTGEKNQLKRMADLAGKPLAEYVRDVAFSTPLSATDKKIVEDLQHLSEKMIQQEADIRYLKKSVYVMIKLLLPIASEQIILRTLLPISPEEKSQEKIQEKAQEKIMSFFKKCVNEAEEKFEIDKKNKE